MPDYQSAVWLASASDDGVCRKPAGTGRAELAGLNWPVPDFSTLCRRQKTLSVAIPYRGSVGPLHLLEDSTGVKAEGEGERNARKHGGSTRRLWRKIHIGVDEQTLEIRAIEVTSSSIGDSPMLPGLLSQIALAQEIGSVTANGAYDTRKCHDAIAARNAHAVIPPRKNAKLWKPDTPGLGRETKWSDPQSIWAVHCGGN